MERFCNDCRWCRRTVIAPPTEFCMRPRTDLKRDPVTGNVSNHPFCANERAHSTFSIFILRLFRIDVCGAKGKFFEPYEPVGFTIQEPDENGFSIVDGPGW